MLHRIDFWAHVNNGKLAPRAIKCMFLGYALESKGYRLWFPDSRKVIQSRDITFKETVMFFPGQESTIPNLQGTNDKVGFKVLHIFLKVEIVFLILVVRTILKKPTPRSNMFLVLFLKNISLYTTTIPSPIP